MTTIEEKIRDLAVRKVDARHGYTMGFSTSPVAHAIEYDEEERLLWESWMAFQVKAVFGVGPHEMFPQGGQEDHG